MNFYARYYDTNISQVKLMQIICNKVVEIEYTELSGQIYSQKGFC